MYKLALTADIDGRNVVHTAIDRRNNNIYSQTSTEWQLYAHILVENTQMFKAIIYLGGKTI